MRQGDRSRRSPSNPLGQLGQRLQATLVAISLVTVSGAPPARAAVEAPINYLSQAPGIEGACERSPQELLDGILTDPQ
ncbi:MAG: hypothetical protein AAGF75_00070 [Cyanobacteria bacterium P01_H01_bin.130]